MNPFRSFRFLDGLRLKDLAHLIECATPGHFGTGERLFKKGDPANDLFLIKTGSVGLRCDEFWAHDIKVVGPGDVIGCPRFAPLDWPVSGYALEPTDVMILHGPRLTGAAAQHPSFGLEIAKRFAELEPKPFAKNTPPVQRLKKNRAESRAGNSKPADRPTEGVVSL